MLLRKSSNAVIIVVVTVTVWVLTSWQVTAGPRDSVSEPEIIVEDVTYGTDAIPLRGILARSQGDR